jgi:peptidyl-tRNA hydrolase
MYLVVRSDLSRTPAEVLLAAAEATMRAVVSLADTDAHRAAFSEWSARSFRKVSVRAKGKHWERLLREYPGACGSARGEPLVCALVPRKRSDNDAFLRGLQVYNPGDPGPVEPTALDAIAPHAMLFACNHSVPMSVGKTVAQVGHAVLICATSAHARANPAVFSPWMDQGFPCALLARDEQTWRDAKAAIGSVTVRDAGLTEVVPGSETVCAVPPGALARR